MIRRCPARGRLPSILAPSRLPLFWATPSSRRFVAHILWTAPSRYVPLATIRRRYSPDWAFALCPPRDDSSHILWAAPSRYVPLVTIQVAKFFWTAPSRNVPLARFVAYPLGCAYALCSPCNDSSCRFSLGRAFALCPPLRRSVNILWAAQSRYVPLATIRRYPLGRAFALCPPLATIRQLKGRAFAPCPPGKNLSPILGRAFALLPLAMIHSQIFWPRLRPCPLAMTRCQFFWPRIRACPLAMIRCLLGRAFALLPLAMICSQIFWPRLCACPLATIHCQYSFGRHNKSVCRCHFGRACLPQDFVAAIAILLHRRLHVPSRRIVIIPILWLRHCTLAVPTTTGRTPHLLWILLIFFGRH